MNPRRHALVAAITLSLACGMGTDGPSGGPSSGAGAQTDESADPAAQAEAPGPWAPSRSLALDRFALETALGVALTEPAGDELSSSTRWTLHGQDVELRFDVRSWFNGAEAERECHAAAGDAVQASLDLGTPVWTTADSAFLTQGEVCIQVRVTRGSATDLAGAAAVVSALVRGG